jgi:hypothetical protein
MEPVLLTGSRGVFRNPTAAILEAGVDEFIADDSLVVRPRLP